MGLATPLLPCGPLYFLVALALLSGSALRGDRVHARLRAGHGAAALARAIPVSLGPAKTFAALAGRMRATLALATAAVIGWRLRATLGFPARIRLNFVCF